MLKEARLLNRPTPAATSPAHPESAKTASSPKDAPFRGQGRSSTADPRFTFHASRFTAAGGAARTLHGKSCVLAHRGWAGEKKDFFSILLDHVSEVFDRATEGILELYLRFPFQESARPTDIGSSDFGIIGRQGMIGDVAR